MTPLLRRPLSPIIQALGKRIEKDRFIRAPIVIGGCARSGTTMLLALLAAHPSVFAFKRELGFLTQWKAGRGPGGKPFPGRIDRFYRELLVRKIPHEVTRWCEKSPANVRHIEKILSFFDEKVRFIHIVRDPRDVCISEHPQPRKSGDYYVSPQRWVEDVRSGKAFEGHPCVLTLHYEDLIRHYDEKVDRICRFLDEEKVPEMMDWSTHTNVQDNPAWKGGVRPLDDSSVGKWHDTRYKDRVNEILEYPGLADLMRHCGYVPEE